MSSKAFAAGSPKRRGARLARTSGAEVRVAELTRLYGTLAAVDRVSFTIASGEFVTLLGASGSGKTTTLMMIAGFTAPSSGEILIDGQSVLRTPPERRNLGVVFQSYALFPHMSVAENVGFPLRMRGMERQAAAGLVGEALEMVHLGGFGDRRISQLSGGQQQRVALARALVFRPPVLLMDEPLGALDRKLREHMQVEIKRIQRDLDLTVIYVTHDQEEALVMSDRIAIMRSGAIEQIDSPVAVYERPATAFVADFLGESNFIPAQVADAAGNRTVVRLPDGRSIAAEPGDGPANGEVQVMVRPEAMELRPATTAQANGANRLEGVVEDVEYLGQSIRYTLRSGDFTLLVREARRGGEDRWERGAAVSVHWSAEATHLLPGAGAPEPAAENSSRARETG